MTPCVINECGKQVVGFGYCDKHYRRFRKLGNATATKISAHGEPLLDRIARHSIQASSGCWLWTGTVSKATGYGQIGYEGKMLLAHRASYMAYRGDIPEGIFVCHKCDVRNCVRPDHLFLGTRQDNTDDMMRKRRNRPMPGEKNANALISESQAIEILGSNESYTVLAAKYGIKKASIYNIKAGHRWQHLRGLRQ